MELAQKVKDLSKKYLRTFAVGASAPAVYNTVLRKFKERVAKVRQQYPTIGDYLSVRAQSQFLPYYAGLGLGAAAVGTPAIYGIEKLTKEQDPTLLLAALITIAATNTASVLYEKRREYSH